MTDDANPETIDELLPETTGTWRVFTRDSSHLFRMDEGTVTREPGPDASESINDRPRPIRSIQACRVGERGRWQMDTDGWSEMVDWYWHVSSMVVRIERIADPDMDADHDVDV